MEIRPKDVTRFKCDEEWSETFHNAILLASSEPHSHVEPDQAKKGEPSLEILSLFKSRKKIGVWAKLIVKLSALKNEDEWDYFTIKEYIIFDAKSNKKYDEHQLDITLMIIFYFFRITGLLKMIYDDGDHCRSYKATPKFVELLKKFV